MTICLGCHHPQPRTHDEFLRLKPVIERYARRAFRHASAGDREEAVAEAVAAALVSFVSLQSRGRDPFGFPRVLAIRAVQHVRSGRQVGTPTCRRDIYTRARESCGRLYFVPSCLGDLAEAVSDNRQTPVPDQVAFRIDVPAWLKSLPPRKRMLAVLLARGESVCSLAARFRLTSARISQIRSELQASWHRYQSEPVPAPT